MKILSNKKYNEMIETLKGQTLEIDRYTSRINSLKYALDVTAEESHNYKLEVEQLKKEIKSLKSKLTRAKKGNK